MLTWRYASSSDIAPLAGLNHQLIRDERHRNRMSVPELENRLADWLKSEYRAVLFEERAKVVAYALYRPEGHAVYLRQFFVCRERRRRGIGREAIGILLKDVLPSVGRFYLDVLIDNAEGRAFWKAVGFDEYALTLELLRPGSGTAVVTP